jgi:hypothetical protein
MDEAARLRAAAQKVREEVEARMRAEAKAAGVDMKGPETSAGSSNGQNLKKKEKKEKLPKKVV